MTIMGGNENENHFNDDKDEEYNFAEQVIKHKKLN
jgi:hypothetical protein